MEALDRVEQFLIELDISWQELSPSAWLIDDESKGLPSMVISHAGPIVMIRVDVMPLPAENREELYTLLLSLNATDLLHGAYGLDGDKVIILDTLEYEGMDKTEFGASLEAMGLALQQHIPLLSRFVGK